MTDMPRTPPATPSFDIAAVQNVRKLWLYALGTIAVGVLLFGHSVWPDGDDLSVHEIIEHTGRVLMIVAIIGRTWCSLYIGGRKKATLVDVGPYSMCRNPLYFFSFIGAAGAGAQFGSITAALAAMFITVIVFTLVVRKEERFLTEVFGDAYVVYKARVPRFLPNPRLWRNVDTLEIRPQLVVRTFVDACVFLASIPLAEGIELAQAQGLLPILWTVP
ncbi:isoprenylcysteine carboxylmethyltransferase family protein [Starkeya sp. 3C]|uniref:Isoprenylcysteine carboxylmethyltransferase family protein n=1 Tax=Ancylobacter moscoviensis TaxID=2597768 RepID=A0ABY3DVY3_9HYPH|nr:isoprenylcysteine carboxylmethyltransferase family protein [Ancylobacter moscoviensis]TSJ64541.1 isoprenylcysteine carboxylmethyltransferase family protein [Ancylobacter moscoviensis]